MLYARDDAERQRHRWKDELESFQRRGVLVLLVTEQEQSPGMKMTHVDHPTSATCTLQSAQEFRLANHLPPNAQYAILLDDSQTIIAQADANLPDSPARFLDVVVNLTPHDLRSLRFKDSFPPGGCPEIY